MTELTQDQRQVAEANHAMVFAFLKEQKLPVEEFYDVVVFGYLSAVQSHCLRKSLRRYRLSTIAWKRMHRELNRYYRSLDAAKRRHDEISLQEPIAEESGKCWQDVLPDQCDKLRLLQTELVIHSLALTPRERRVLQRRKQGDDMHEIARSEKMTFRSINLLLARLHGVITRALNE